MASIKNFFAGLFKRNAISDDVKTPLLPMITYREESRKPLIGPKEELFLPVRTEIGDKLNLDGYELPGITFQVRVNDTQPSVLPEAPPSFPGLHYNTDQFRVGLNDGYAGISPQYNIDNLPQAHEINKALSYPLRPLERIAAAEAKKVWLDLFIEQRKNELEDLEKTEKDWQTRSVSLQDLRKKRLDDEFEAEEQRRALAGREQAEPVVEVKEENAGQQNVLGRFVTGVFLTACGLIFMIADIALSIAAIYALGFQDIEGAKWNEAIFNTSLWKTHWEGVFVCLGFAAITIFFKYAYERLVHSTKKLRGFELAFFTTLSIICSVTVCFLGVLRADYLLKNMQAAVQIDTQKLTANPQSPAVPDSTKPAPVAKDEQEFFGVNHQVAFGAMLLTTILFPLLGGVALSEGLSRMFGGLGEIFHHIARPFSRVTKKFTEVAQNAAPTALDKENNMVDSRLNTVYHQRRLLRDELNNAEREKFLIDQLLPVWQKALEQYKDSLNEMAELERLLYMHGYEQGRILRGSHQGSSKIISGILANELTLRAGDDLFEATNGKANGGSELIPHPLPSFQGA